ncbi:MAG: ferrous iron transport protein B, partial [Anaerolineae bacterium]|nr:ferrous iron transport protein B [Anaerolineae bacterium]
MTNALPATTDSIVVALAGQPNVGKSTIFNLLTGLNQHVGNWPGKTVERKTGEYSYRHHKLLLVDLPGTYSLSAQSAEERIAREYIITQSPDVVVAVVDAAILERSLYLLAEVILLPAPVVVVLNMIDVAEQEGVKIEPKVLEAALGIPVVAMCATRNEGITEMLDAILALHEGETVYTPRRPTILPDHETILNDLITLIADSVPALYPVDWIALKLLEGDDEIIKMMKSRLTDAVWSEVHHILFTHEDAVLDIAGARYAWISRMIRAAVARPKVGQLGLTARLDQFFTAPLWGTLSLLGVLGIVFWLTYAIGTPLQDWLDGLLQQLADSVILLLTPLTPQWFVYFVSDGLLGGTGMVLTFLPILLIFFTTLGLLEDTGYMARAAYIMDRYMHVMGLHGKSFIPLLLGFGCNVPSVMGARIIESKRARFLTILLAPFVPCTAQMAVIAILASAFFGRTAALVAWGLVCTNLLFLVVVGIIIRKVVYKGEQAAFIMELPLYHMPNWRSIGIYVWQNVVAFIHKAG